MPKSCSIIYTRNQHNHGMENVKNIRKRHEEKINPLSPVFEQEDYVDRFDKLWSFHANTGKQISQPNIFRKKFGFKIHRTNTTTLNLYCTKKKLAFGERCPFVGIYLMSNGCLYVRGKHEHRQRGKTPQNVGDDYVDRHGKTWTFHAKISKQRILCELWHNKFGFSTIVHNQSTVNLYCHKRTKKAEDANFVEFISKRMYVYISVQNMNTNKE